jgi:hypothetical protein
MFSQRGTVRGKNPADLTHNLDETINVISKSVFSPQLPLNAVVTQAPVRR